MFAMAFDGKVGVVRYSEEWMAARAIGEALEDDFGGTEGFYAAPLAETDAMAARYAVVKIG